MVGEGVDRTLREERAHRERHVGRRHHLLNGDADHPRETTTAISLLEGHRSPSGVHVGLVGLAEPGRRGDAAVVVASHAEGVAHAVERGQLLLHEAGRFGEKVAHHGRVGAGETRHFEYAVESADPVEHEVDVVERSAVVGHARQAK